MINRNIFNAITYYPGSFMKIQKKMDNMRPYNHYYFSEINGKFLYRTEVLYNKNKFTEMYFKKQREELINDSRAKIRSNESKPPCR